MISQEKTVLEVGLEVETRHGEEVIVPSSTETAPAGDLDIEVDHPEDVAATRVAESTPVTAGAIVVRNPLLVADSVTGATFVPPYLVPYPYHVLVGGFSVSQIRDAIYQDIGKVWTHRSNQKGH